MKKIALSAVLITSLGLVACGSQEELKEEEKVSITQEKETKNEAIEEQKEELVNNPDETVSNEQSTTVYQNEAFKDVTVTEKAEKIVVTGKAQVFEGNFQYKLYDGNKVLLENHYQTDGAPAWGDFEIEFEKTLVNNDNVKFELFVYSPKDGAKVNVLEIPVQ